jgi:hypothetical protein
MRLSTLIEVYRQGDTTSVFARYMVSEEVETEDIELDDTGELMRVSR